MKSAFFSLIFPILSLSLVSTAFANEKPTVECGGYYSGKGVQGDGEPILIRSSHPLLELGDLILVFVSYVVSGGNNLLYPLEYRFVKAESEGQLKKYFYFGINQSGKPETAAPDRVLIVDEKGKASFYNIIENGKLVPVTAKLACK